MKSDFSNHPKNPSQKLSLGSFQHYQSLSPCNPDLSSSKKHSSLINFTYSSRSTDPNAENLKIKEAYQFLKLRKIGCTRTEAISLASKFKIKRECCLSNFSPEFKKWNKNFNENKYSPKNYSEEDLMNMTKICEDSVGSYDKTNRKNKRKINLRIFTRNQSNEAKSERDHNNCINLAIDTAKNKRKKGNFTKEVPFSSIYTGNYKSSSDLRVVKGENYSIRKNIFNHSGSVEEEYFELLEREKELREKINAHKNLISKTEKKAKFNTIKQKNNKKVPNNLNLEHQLTTHKHKTK